MQWGFIGLRLRFPRCLEIVGLALLVWGWTTSCSGQFPLTRAPDSFLPPTASQGTTAPMFLSSTPTPTATPREARPTPTPMCTNVLSFLEDVTIPDGTVVQPGESLDKRWKVENSGTCNWDHRYRLKLVSGPSLGAAPEQALYPARSGSQVEIRIVFTAPTEPGTYRCAWQAYDPQGNPFGDQFFIDFVVEAPPP